MWCMEGEVEDERRTGFHADRGEIKARKEERVKKRRRGSALKLFERSLQPPGQALPSPALHLLHPNRKIDLLLTTSINFNFG